MTNSSTTPSTVTTCTVLLVDDNPEHLVFWATALRTCSSNYSVLEASCGHEGLEVLRHHKVCCVILDLDLPDSSGFHFLFDLVPDRDRPQIAVLILTHLVHPNLAEMAVHNGAQAYLVKQHTSTDVLDRTIQIAVTSVASALNR